MQYSPEREINTSQTSAEFELVAISTLFPVDHGLSPELPGGAANAFFARGQDRSLRLLTAQHVVTQGYGDILSPITGTREGRILFSQNGADAAWSEVFEAEVSALPLYYEALQVGQRLQAQGLRHIGHRQFKPFTIDTIYKGQTVDDGKTVHQALIVTGQPQPGDSGSPLIITHDSSGHLIEPKVVGVLRGVSQEHEGMMLLFSGFWME